MSSKADLAFIKEFQQRVTAFVLTFVEVERMEEGMEEEGGRRFAEPEYTQEQAKELVRTFRSQREIVTSMLDRARAIAERYEVHEEFYDLIKAEPRGEPGEWGRVKYIHDRFLRELDDTFVRLIAAIEHAPPSPNPVYIASVSTWKWLDARGIARWIVVVLIVLPFLTVLKWLGYDLQALTALAKAIWGK